MSDPSPQDPTVPEAPGKAPLFELDDVTVTYGQRGRPAFTALRGVSLRVGAGEVVGLVGESGSGKSTLGRTAFGLVPVTGGRVLFEGRDVTRAGRRERRALTSRIQMVFQDPYGSLNPSRTIEDTLVEPLLAHEPRTSRREREERAAHVLDLVGLPAQAARRLPAEFSGGQRQRIAIARALMLRPALIVCDEAVSALDLSMQAQVLNLLSDLRDELGVSYLFISHDLTVVRHVADRVVVLYRGAVVEEGHPDGLAERPRHPYTDALQLAAPVPDPAAQRRRRLSFESRLRHTGVPAGNGCAFAPRCAHAVDACGTEFPRLRDLGPASAAACHRAEELRLGPTAASADIVSSK